VGTNLIPLPATAESTQLQRAAQQRSHLSIDDLLSNSGAASPTPVLLPSLSSPITQRADRPLQPVGLLEATCLTESELPPRETIDRDPYAALASLRDNAVVAPGMSTVFKSLEPPPPATTNDETLGHVAPAQSINAQHLIMTQMNKPEDDDFQPFVQAQAEDYESPTRWRDF
jgi:hypothetical protein